ncbi:MAG: crossover junction endodeoxyribonuclease RuvC [Gemmatimonadales bacterium]
MTLRVLGVDPGTAVTGYAVVEPSQGRPGRLVECGVIRTDTKRPIWLRLETLYDGVSGLIAQHEPTAMAIEGVFYGKNVRTTVALGHARGVMLLAAAKAGVEMAEFSPATVKKTVAGVGGATKEQIAFMVQRLLALKSAPSPRDASDACAIALTYLLTSRVPV